MATERPRSSVRLTVIAVSYAVIAVAATWPLARDFSSRVAGDSIDPWQTLWGFWWWHRSVASGKSPMFSDLLWWPDGTSLWFQSWDIPSAVLVLPLWGRLPAEAVYNLPLFLAFPLSGLACYFLCRELWGGTLGPFLAGCLYTFSTCHFGQATANLHMASMQWSPLYFCAVTIAIRRSSFTARVVAGVALALATLASIYHLVFCLLGTLVIVATAGLVSDARFVTVLKRVGVIGAVWMALAGWLLAGMAATYLSEPYAGSHPAPMFSADLQSFFVPNAVNIWSQHTSAWQRWTRGQWVSAAYPGYILVGLGLSGAWMSRTARSYLIVAAVGALLALGPVLRIAGVSYGRLLMPYAIVEKMVPVLAFSGLPSRYTWLTTFGLAVASGAVLSKLCAHSARCRLLALALTACALVEVWPRPQMTTSYPRPQPLAEWSTDRQRWAVLDTTGWSRALWHQTIHNHPIVAGYTTRLSDRLWDKLTHDPVLTLLLGPMVPSPAVVRSVGAQEARDKLRELNIRFVIVDAVRASSPSIAMVLSSMSNRYRGEGIVIYEIDP